MHQLTHFIQRIRQRCQFVVADIQRSPSAKTKTQAFRTILHNVCCLSPTSLAQSDLLIYFKYMENSFSNAYLKSTGESLTPSCLLNAYDKTDVNPTGL